MAPRREGPGVKIVKGKKASKKEQQEEASRMEGDIPSKRVVKEQMHPGGKQHRLREK